MYQRVFDKRFREEISDRIYRDGVALGEAGRKIFGVYCAFTPKEIIAAATAIPVALCSGSQTPISTAEAMLPRQLCPLIKSTFGHALSGSCPYMEETEFIFADMTCDGKKKMFAFLQRLKPLHMLALPQENQRESSLTQWLAELHTMAKIVERLTGVTITDEALSEQIRLYNRMRKAVEAVYALNQGDVPLITGREISAITEEGAGFEFDLDKRADNIFAYVDMVRKRSSDESFIRLMEKRPRILLTGCPTTNDKVLDIIEDAGAVVVAMENCGGLKTTAAVMENGDPMEALARRYIATACPCMTPNAARFELITRLAKSHGADGVVELTWENCHTYNVEAGLINEHVSETLGIPYLQVRTDYTEQDRPQLMLRVQAFLEML